MIVKRCILLLIFLIISNQIFTLSISRESFYIVNFSSKTLIITKEYRDDPTQVFLPYDPYSWPYEPWHWDQSVCGINLWFIDRNLIRNEIRVLPNRVLTIIDFSPSFNPGGMVNGIEDSIYLDQLPIINILRSLYSKFTIATEDGEILVTLDNIEERIIRRAETIGIVGGARYRLEIFDSDIR